MSAFSVSTARWWVVGLLLPLDWGNPLLASTGIGSLINPDIGLSSSLQTKQVEVPVKVFRLKSGGLGQKLLQKMAEKRLKRWQGKAHVSPEKTKRTVPGILLFFLGVAATLGTVLLALLSANIGLLLLASILGYSLAVYIFTRAYAALFPEMHWRILLAILTPILSLAAIVVIAGLFG